MVGKWRTKRRSSLRLGGLGLRTEMFSVRSPKITLEDFGVETYILLSSFFSYYNLIEGHC